MIGQYTTLAAGVVLRYASHLAICFSEGETMEIDRRAFFAGLGGVAAVAAMERSLQAAPAVLMAAAQARLPQVAPS